MKRTLALATFLLALAAHAAPQSADAPPAAGPPAASPASPATAPGTDKKSAKRADKSVDADMQQVLDAAKASGAKPLHTLTPQQARMQPTAKDAVQAVLSKKGQQPKPTPLAKVEDRKIPGSSAPIEVRVYTPEGKGPFPGVVYFHGGGFVVANIDTYDASARAIAKQSGAVVVSVHYRQAPESPLPAAHEDASAAFQWVRANAKELGIDADRIAVAGESAGANLAAYVANAHKDNVVHQLLIYPFVSTDLTTPSHQRNGTGEYLVANADLAWFWKHALGEGQKGDARTVPLLATADALRGVPAATVMVASLDPLHDDGVAYAKKLEQSGVRVELKEYQGVTHEFFGMDAVVADAKTAQKDAGTALKRAFAAKAKNPSVGR